MHSLREPHQMLFEWNENSTHNTALTHIMNEPSATLALYYKQKLRRQSEDTRFPIPFPYFFSFSLFTRELSAFEVEKQRLQCRGAGDVFQHVNWCVPNQWAATNPKELNQNNKQANHAIASSKKKSSQSSGVKKKNGKYRKMYGRA